MNEFGLDIDFVDVVTIAGDSSFSIFYRKYILINNNYDIEEIYFYHVAISSFRRLMINVLCIRLSEIL